MSAAPQIPQGFLLVPDTPHHNFNNDHGLHNNGLHFREWFRGLGITLPSRLCLLVEAHYHRCLDCTDLLMLNAEDVACEQFNLLAEYTEEYPDYLDVIVDEQCAHHNGNWHDSTYCYWMGCPVLRQSSAMTGCPASCHRSLLYCDFSATSPILSPYEPRPASSQRSLSYGRYSPTSPARPELYGPPSPSARSPVPESPEERSMPSSDSEVESIERPDCEELYTSAVDNEAHIYTQDYEQENEDEEHDDAVAVKIKVEDDSAFRLQPTTSTLTPSEPPGGRKRRRRSSTAVESPRGPKRRHISRAQLRFALPADYDAERESRRLRSLPAPLHGVRFRLPASYSPERERKRLRSPNPFASMAEEADSGDEREDQAVSDGCATQ